MFLILSIIALLCGYFWVKKRYSFWKNRGFLTVKPSFPFGNSSGVGYKITGTEAFDQIYKQFKGQSSILGMYTFLAPTLMPIDPELVKNILVRDFNSFHDRGFYYNRKDDPLNANMLSVEGAEWKDLRTKLSPTFSSGKIKMMFDIVREVSDRLVKVVGDEIENDQSNIEMREYTAKFTTDVIGNVAFGIECNCLEDPNSEFRKYGKNVFGILSPSLLLKFFFTTIAPEFSKKIGIVLSDKATCEYFFKTFKEAFALREKQKLTGIKRNDFLELLLKLKKVGDNDGLTVEQMAANSFLFYGGGFETSSTAITYSLYELALNQEIQEKLRQEIQDTLVNDGKLTYDNLFQMKYLDNVINETLRKYPPIPHAIRMCTKEYRIPNTNLVIPVGINVQIPIYSFHHDEEYFPNPNIYDPSRFSDENISKINMKTYLPFGDGPRSCIGMRFGIMQSKIGLVKLIQNFKFDVNTKTTIPMKFDPSSPFLAPLNGMWLTVKKNNNM